MPLAIRRVIDISLELDDSKFKMRTPPGFKRDMQFQLEVLKEHDAPEGAGQGIFPRSIELEDFDAFIREDVAKLGALAKAVGAKAN